MAGLIGGALAGMAQGAAYVAKNQIDSNSAADLAQINSNIAVERDARVRENTRAANERDVAAIESSVPLDTPDRAQELTRAGVRSGNFLAADQLRKEPEAEDRRRAHEATLEERRLASLDRKDAAAERSQNMRESRDRVSRSEEDRAREKDVQAASQVYGRLKKAQTDGERSLKDVSDEEMQEMAIEQVRRYRGTDFTKKPTGPTPSETARSERESGAVAIKQATSEVNDAANPLLPDFLDPNIKGSRDGMINQLAKEKLRAGNPATAKPASPPVTSQADDVKAAFKAGRITREQAKAELAKIESAASGQ